MAHRDHYAPHLKRAFNGYYTRVQLADGATLAGIFCWVRKAPERKNLVLVCYTPCVRLPTAPPSQAPSTATLAGSSTGNTTLLGDTTSSLPYPCADPRAFKYEFYPENFELTVGPMHHPHASFTISAPGVGHMKVTVNEVEYCISVPDRNLHVHLTLDAHVPWDPAKPRRGPMGRILHLSSLLPLNWHVRSTASRATYAVAHHGNKVRGIGLAHVENNWGDSFPTGWIWAQVFDAQPHVDASGSVYAPIDSEDVAGEPGEDEGTRSFAMAGGQAFMGVQAYLVGYHSLKCNWDFRPPVAMGLGRLSPFMHVRHDSRSGAVEIWLRTWRRCLEVAIEAPPETFIGMSAPLPKGHEPGFARESFQATVRVKAERWRWPWSQWEVVDEVMLGRTADGLSCGALEFGGAFYKVGEDVV
ncbi:hypothetical protein DICSQDRAFT_174624 [Dichomitus squalens LYAD-421 SS1]|uniref:Tocopherol cyclase-domain-containing protein n=1 Tax=Dichomitus squalens (strain LYAD-421) TaxID=732165 RepID=R7SKV8_DICSQ|nr:uncharacterized protein DICSQDRAFT_174624 [Dichomitus squalens LYAD-421 SS1]EJF56764.1 hypothetical protein DICSQDRAFT_174624 [Dichomitus squalens LYAD-421 SS1]